MGSSIKTDIKKAAFSGSLQTIEKAIARAENE